MKADYLSGHASPDPSPGSEQDNPIAKIRFGQANPIRAILGEKWEEGKHLQWEAGKKWVGERVHKVGDGVGVKMKDYTIKMHLTRE